MVIGGTVREVDVALANDLRYLGVAGLGFDSEVADFANRNVKFLRGSAVYLYAILRVLPQFTPRPVRIRTENGTRDEQIMFAAVGNTRQYGGGIRITPDAVVDDGLLDLCIVHETTRAAAAEDAAEGLHRRAREEPVRGDGPRTRVSLRERKADGGVRGWGAVDADAGVVRGAAQRLRVVVPE